eukprot:scaffold178895_cov17-Tisochrysis_lutea.AAC.2
MPGGAVAPAPQPSPFWGMGPTSGPARSGPLGGVLSGRPAQPPNVLSRLIGGHKEQQPPPQQQQLQHPSSHAPRAPRSPSLPADSGGWGGAYEPPSFVPPPP